MKANYITTIGGIAEIYDGPHATPKKLEQGPYFLSISSLDKGRLELNKSAFLSEDDFKKWTKRVTPQEGDLLFSYETRLGEAALMPAGVRACLGRRMGLLRLNKAKVTPEYALYAYLSPAFQQTIKANTLTGATVNRIALNDLPNFPIRIPPIEEQKKVAKLLSGIDKKIELNNHINAELEAMAKTLYDYWFVQFDFPDDSPQRKGKPYKSSGGKMVYNPILKREIPEGWGVKKLSEIAMTGSGGTPLSSNPEFYENGTIPWINSGELNSQFIVSTSNFITELGLEKSSAKLCPKNTILMAMYGATAGKVSFIDFPATTNQAICTINPFDQEMNVYLKFTLERLYQYLINLSSGSARDNLSQDKIKSLDVVIPAPSALTQFHEFTKSKMELILTNLKENQELTSLRDWLLPMLMNGQVTVK